MNTCAWASAAAVPSVVCDVDPLRGITNLLRAVFLADVCSMVVRACVGSLWVNAELREFCDGSCDVLRTLPTLVQQGVKSLGNFTSITLPFISQGFEVFSLVGE